MRCLTSTVDAATVLVLIAFFAQAAPTTRTRSESTLSFNGHSQVTTQQTAFPGTSRYLRIRYPPYFGPRAPSSTGLQSPLVFSAYRTPVDTSPKFSKSGENIGKAGDPAVSIGNNVVGENSQTTPADVTKPVVGPVSEASQKKTVTFNPILKYRIFTDPKSEDEYASSTPTEAGSPVFPPGLLSTSPDHAQGTFQKMAPPSDGGEGGILSPGFQKLGPNYGSPRTPAGSAPTSISTHPPQLDLHKGVTAMETPAHSPTAVSAPKGTSEKPTSSNDGEGGILAPSLANLKANHDSTGMPADSVPGSTSTQSPTLDLHKNEAGIEIPAHSPTAGSTPKGKIEKPATSSEGGDGGILGPSLAKLKQDYGSPKMPAEGGILGPSLARIKQDEDSPKTRADSSSSTQSPPLDLHKDVTVTGLPSPYAAAGSVISADSIKEPRSLSLNHAASGTLEENSDQVADHPRPPRARRPNPTVESSAQVFTKDARAIQRKVHYPPTAPSLTPSESSQGAVPGGGDTGSLLMFLHTGGTYPPPLSIPSKPARRSTHPRTPTSPSSSLPQRADSMPTSTDPQPDPSTPVSVHTPPPSAHNVGELQSHQQSIQRQHASRTPVLGNQKGTNYSRRTGDPPESPTATPQSPNQRQNIGPAFGHKRDRHAPLFGTPTMQGSPTHSEESKSEGGSSHPK